MDKVLLAFGAVLFSLVFVFGFAFLMAYPLMWCYNGVFPYLFGLPVMNFWHSFCLYMFVGILGLRNTSSSDK